MYIVFVASGGQLGITDAFGALLLSVRQQKQIWRTYMLKMI